jgi:Family of unknown function (DUF5317)
VGLTVIALVLAVVTATLLGGSMTRLTSVPLRGRRLIVAALAGQAGGALVGLLGVGDPHHAYVAGLALSAGCALAFCARNLRVHGLPLVTAGLVANAVVVGLNGAMPVSIVAAARAGVPITAIADGVDARHAIAGVGTVWPWLGDVIAVPLPWRPEVVSAGDVLVASGLGELVLLAMLGTGVSRAIRRDEPATPPTRS